MLSSLLSSLCASHCPGTERFDQSLNIHIQRHDRWTHWGLKETVLSERGGPSGRPEGSFPALLLQTSSFDLSPSLLFVQPVQQRDKGNGERRKGGREVRERGRRGKGSKNTLEFCPVCLCISHKMDSHRPS